MQVEKKINADPILKNFIYQASYQILSLILPLITAPYISRILGAEGTGIYSYTNSILYFFTMMANLGISNYGNREISAAMEDKEKLSRTFWEIYICHASTTLLIGVFYGIYLTSFNTFYHEIFLWQGIQLIAVFFDITWFFSGIQKFKITVRRNFIVRLFCVVAIFLFVKEKNDLWKYVLILAASNLIGQLAVWFQIKQYILPVKIKIKNIFSHFLPMFVLFIPIVAMSIYRYMDKVMIPLFSSVDELGLYENSEKIISLSLSLISTIGVVLLPKMSSIVKKEDKNLIEYYIENSMKYSYILAFGLTGGIIGIAPIFAPVFFGEEFVKCGELLSLLAITILFITWSNSIRSQYLIPNKKDIGFIVSAFSGSALNLVLNVFLIRHIGAKGAVIATILTELVVALIHTLYSYKSINFIKILKSIYIFFFPAGLMLFFVRVVGAILGEHVYTLVLQILTGALLYLISVGLILYIQRDALFLRITEKIKKRIRKK